MIKISPEKPFIDDIISFEISSLTPETPYLLVLSTKDEADTLWESQTVFQSSKKGVINTKKDRSSLSPDTPEPMALFWSLATKAHKHAFFKKTLNDHDFKLTVYQNGQQIEALNFKVKFKSAEIKIEKIEQNDLYAVYFEPSKKRSKQVMLLLGGSNGKLPIHYAALLASRGIPCITVAYFKIKTLPKQLIHIPVETVKRALDWLQSEKQIDAKNIGLIGSSKGAEFALLAATFYDLSPVFSISGSTFSTQGIGSWEKPKSSWTYEKKPLPFLKVTFSWQHKWHIFWRWSLKKAVSMLPAYQMTLNKTPMEELAKTLIPLEKIPGKITLFSGEQDQIWPSTQYGETGKSYLKAEKKGDFVQHLSYPSAGHLTFVAPPNLPQGSELGTTKALLIGGNSYETTKAMAKTWQSIKDLLATNP